MVNHPNRKQKTLITYKLTGPGGQVTTETKVLSWTKPGLVSEIDCLLYLEQEHGKGSVKIVNRKRA